MRGERIGRYSKKSRDIQAKLEIKAGEFGGETVEGRRRLLSDALVGILGRIECKVPTDEPHQIRGLIEDLARLNQRFVQSGINDGKSQTDGPPVLVAADRGKEGANVPSSRSMKYQLVLQMSASAIKHYDAMIEIEDALIDGLSDAEHVDGHDCGSGEANIFILTDSPTETFRRVQAILGEGELWARLRIAYREVAGDEYTVLWPKHLTTFKVT